MYFKRLIVSSFFIGFLVLVAEESFIAPPKEKKKEKHSQEDYALLVEEIHHSNLVESELLVQVERAQACVLSDIIGGAKDPMDWELLQRFKQDSVKHREQLLEQRNYFSSLKKKKSKK